jgi:hypothetical protein
MHRSGTSALTLLLEHAGLSTCAGEHLHRPTEFNPAGNRENRPLRLVNDRLLAAFGGEWSAPPPLGPDWTVDPRARRLHRPAARVLRRTMPQGAWVWKDPRLCLTLPFWLPLLGRQPALVISRRNPLEVAASLERRNQLPTVLSLALWERYTRSALAAAAGAPLATVDYDRLSADPATELAELSDALAGAGVTLRPVPADRLSELIDDSYRHGRSTVTDLGPVSGVSIQAAALHEVVRGLPRFSPAFRVPALPDETPGIDEWFARRADERRAARETRPGRGRRALARALRRET